MSIQESQRQAVARRRQDRGSAAYLEVSRKAGRVRAYAGLAAAGLRSLPVGSSCTTPGQAWLKTRAGWVNSQTAALRSSAFLADLGVGGVWTP